MLARRSLCGGPRVCSDSVCADSHICRYSQRRVLLDLFATRYLHGYACTEMLVWRTLHGYACTEMLVWRCLRRGSCTEMLAVRCLLGDGSTAQRWSALLRVQPSPGRRLSGGAECETTHALNASSVFRKFLHVVVIASLQMHDTNSGCTNSGFPPTPLRFLTFRPRARWSRRSPGVPPFILILYS